MNASTRALGLVIGVQEYGEDAGLGPVPGALAEAVTFRDWLIDVRRADPTDVFVCTNPIIEGTTCPVFEATKDGIYKAARGLVREAAYEDADIFILYSGHGARVDGLEEEDVLLPSDFHANGYKSIRLAQFRRELQRAVGRARQFWFVNSCRTFTDLVVDDFSLRLRLQEVGQAHRPGTLFATAAGQPAPGTGPFPEALREALLGGRRAKRWENGKYWVVFEAMGELVRTVCEPAGLRVVCDPGEIDGRIRALEPPPLPPVPVTVVVEGARDDDRFTLSVSGNRHGEERPFTGPRGMVEVPPGDYWATLKGAGFELRYPERVDMFEPAEVEFVLPLENRSGDREADPPGVKVPSTGPSHVASLRTGTDRSGTDHTVDQPDISPLLASVAAAVLAGIQPGIPPVDAATRSRSPAGWQSAIYVLTLLALESVTVASEPTTVVMTPVPGVLGVRHAWVPVEPGPHRVHASVEGGEVELATATLPGQVTIVVLDAPPGGPGTPGTRLDPLQFACQPPQPPAEALSVIEFGARIQRRSAAGAAVLGENSPAEHAELWSRLRSGRWPDAMTLLVAGYELVRQGALADEPEGFRNLLTTLWTRFAGAETPDLAILAALADDVTPNVEGTPLVLDGAVDCRLTAAASPPGMALRYTGLWTRWQTWGAHARLGSTGRGEIRRLPAMTFADNLEQQLAAAENTGTAAAAHHTSENLEVDVQLTRGGRLTILAGLEMAAAEAALLVRDHGALFLPIVVQAASHAVRYWVSLRPGDGELEGRIDLQAQEAGVRVESGGPLVGLEGLDGLDGLDLLPSLRAMDDANGAGLRALRRLSTTLDPSHPLRLALRWHDEEPK